MIVVSYDRRTVLRWAAAVLGLVLLLAYVRAYRPRAERLADRAAAVQAREATVRQARRGSAVERPAGLDALRSALRADSLRLDVRVPDAREAPALPAEIRAALGRLARGAGVRVTSTDPLPAGADGAFLTGGFAVRVAGRYEDIGVLLAQLAALERLVRVRDLHLHAVPDTLLRDVRPTPGAAPERDALLADSAGLARSLADAGEPPFRAAASFRIEWFVRPEASGAVAAPPLATSLPEALP